MANKKISKEAKGKAEMSYDEIQEETRRKRLEYAMQMIEKMNEEDLDVMLQHVCKQQQHFKSGRRFERMKAAEKESKKKERLKMVDSLFKSQEERVKFGEFMSKKRRKKELKVVEKIQVADMVPHDSTASSEKDEEAKGMEDSSSSRSGFSTDDEAHQSFIENLIEKIEKFRRGEETGENEEFLAQATDSDDCDSMEVVSTDEERSSGDDNSVDDDVDDSEGGQMDFGEDEGLEKSGSDCDSD